MLALEQTHGIRMGLGVSLRDPLTAGENELGR